MSVPDIHTCIQLTSENEKLRKKLCKVKQQRDQYFSELRRIEEKAKEEKLLRSLVTSRDAYAQTDHTRLWQPPQVKKKEDTKQKFDTEQANKLLSMHNQLMRRYEKEVKMNMTHIETITDLNMRIADLEKKLKEERDNVVRLEREVSDQIRQSRSRTAKQKKGQRSRSSSPIRSSENEKLNKLMREHEKARKENLKLKKELKGLDLGFFEEIEDIKFGLQQATRLNKEYEKTLRKMCMRFGVPYPHPEKCLEKG